MKLTHLILPAAAFLLLTVGCADTYVYSPYPSVPANYATFYYEIDTSSDYLIFTGAYNPTGPANGAGTNRLYLRSFTPVIAPAASTLVGSTWVGRMSDVNAPQLTISVTSPTNVDIKLDCYFSGTNILAGTAAVSLPALLNGNTVAFREVFRIINTSTTDPYTFCAFTANTDSFRFSTDTGTAAVTTSGGTLLGSFTRQP